MKFTGKIYVALPEKNGVSERTGEPWLSREVIFEAKNHEKVIVRAKTELVPELNELIENHLSGTFSIEVWCSVRTYVAQSGKVSYFSDNSLESIELIPDAETEQGGGDESQS